MVKVYNKLVRDNIINIIKKENKDCNYKVLNDEEYINSLIIKLIEEHNEFNESNDINELADMQEVINCLVKAKGYTLEEFDNIRQKKALKNGSFNEKIYLIDVNDI